LMITLLVDQNERLTRELMRLDARLPRRFQLPDGRIVRYDPPDAIIPIENNLLDNEAER